MTDTATTPLLLSASATCEVRTANIEDGLLVIRTATRIDAPTRVQRYAVEEIPPDRIGCRAFILTDADGSESRVTVVGGMPYCSCPAGQKGHRRGSCKHKDALDALIRDGRIPPTQGP